MSSPPLLAALTLGSALALVPVTRAQEPALDGGARALITSTVAQVSDLLKDEELKPVEKRERFQELIDDHLDIEAVSKSVLRHSWDQWKQPQRKEFQHLFIRHLVTVYWDNVEAGFDRIEVESEEPEPESEVYRRVRTRVFRADEEPTRIEFLLEQDSGSEWKIIDLVVDGVSQDLLFREEFKPIVRSRGPDALLEILETKVQEAEARLRGQE
jgi:phospholipid transport system substrate-binding protein